MSSGNYCVPTDHVISFNPTAADTALTTSTLTFTQSGVSVKAYAYGYSTTGNYSANLYYRNDSAGSVGLGIASTVGSVSNEINSTSFIQLDFKDLLCKLIPGKIPSITLSSVQNPTTGSYQVYGSNAHGDLGTLLISGATETQTDPWPITVTDSTQTFPIPSFNTDCAYRFISVIASPDTDSDIILSALSYTSCDVDGVAVIPCPCQPDCPPPCPPCPEPEECAPTYVQMDMEIAPIVNLKIKKPKICLINEARCKPSKPCYKIQDDCDC